MLFSWTWSMSLLTKICHGGFIVAFLGTESLFLEYVTIIVMAHGCVFFTSPIVACHELTR